MDKIDQLLKHCLNGDASSQEREELIKLIRSGDYHQHIREFLTEGADCAVLKAALHVDIAEVKAIVQKLPVKEVTLFVGHWLLREVQ